MKINRRKFVRNVGYSALLASVGVTFTGCSTKSIIAWAGTAVSFLEQTLPYFQDLLPGSVGILTQAITVAKDLQTALKAGSANAVDFIKQLIAPDGLFQKILDDVGLIQNPQTRRIVSGILAIAGVALNIIATALEQGSTQLPKAIVAKAKTERKAGVAAVEVIAKSNTLDKVLAALKK